MQRPITHARTQGNPFGVTWPLVIMGDVWWLHFPSKGPTMLDIAPLPVAHAHAITSGQVLFRWLHFRSRDFRWHHFRLGSVTWLPVTSLPVRVGHVTAGRSTAWIHRKCDLSYPHILLTSVETVMKKVRGFDIRSFPHSWLVTGFVTRVA